MAEKHVHTHVCVTFTLDSIRESGNGGLMALEHSLDTKNGHDHITLLFCQDCRMHVKIISHFGPIVPDMAETGPGFIAEMIISGAEQLMKERKEVSLTVKEEG